MKKLSLILVIALSVFSFTSSHIDNFVADTKKSSVKWTGSKVVGDSHYGGISISKGAVMMDHGKLVAANFVIDMKSITCTDIESEKYNQKLIDHLNNEDFFNVEKFPTAEFKLITSKKISEGKHAVTGEIVIKEFRDIVKFDMQSSERNGVISTSGKFTFDRTKFDVIYGSGTFFDNLGDKAISNDVTIEFNIVASK
jgi:polyisoprenoid-binding protein YceI